MAAAEPPEPKRDARAGEPFSTARIALTDSKDALGQVRVCVRSLLAAHNADRVMDILLAIDELLSAHRRSELARPRELRLTIVDAGLGLLAEIDSSNTRATVEHRPDLEGVGRLALEQLTADWGLREQDEYTTTWARFDLTAPAAGED